MNIGIEGKGKAVFVLLVVAMSSVVGGTILTGNSYHHDAIPLLTVANVDSLTGHKWTYLCGNNQSESHSTGMQAADQNGSAGTTEGNLPPGLQIRSVEALGSLNSSSNIISIAAFNFSNSSCALDFFNHTMNAGWIGPPFHHPEVGNRIIWYYVNDSYTFGNLTTRQSLIIGYRSNTVIEISALYMTLGQKASLNLLTAQENLIF
ncbi:MAG: hypothetical protein M1533_03890 [Candidatus Thermoplasmatota archaeon]|jgi:hypothetical protein|nr:hypothetical protein [Candidatus Thermoplasmatota archaeon]MCL5793291.1 hypothetical protein [Candidatus Thermoplasmatota archaeon]